MEATTTPQSWSQRNEQAQALGYRNYYDYRAHGYGERAPSEARLSGEALAMARGHRSLADLEQIADRVLVASVIGEERNNAGQYVTATVIVQMDDGTVRQYRLRGGQLGRDQLQDFIEDVEAQGGQVIEWESP